MASTQEIRHRSKEEQEDQVQVPEKQQKDTKKTSRARRGFRSLSLALSVPLLLTILDIYWFGSTRKIEKPFYFPPLWALHLASLGTVFLSGLSAWLVWAEGGFHRQPNALILYLGQLLIGLVWYPVVFGVGAFRTGLVLCAALFGVLIGCSLIFKKLNPIAGDLIKGSLVWAVLVAAVNFRLVYH